MRIQICDQVFHIYLYESRYSYITGYYKISRDGASYEFHLQDIEKKNVRYRATDPRYIEWVEKEFRLYFSLYRRAIRKWKQIEKEEAK